MMQCNSRPHYTKGVIVVPLLAARRARLVLHRGAIA